MIFCAGVFAEEKVAAPALDAGKYPQSTPAEALVSIIKALETRDLAYWVGNLILPSDTKRLVEKHGSVENVAARNADPARASKLKSQCELMKKLLETNKTTQGETDGMKWVRYHSDATILQFEKQADGRWYMNTRVTTMEKATEAIEKKD